MAVAETTPLDALIEAIERFVQVPTLELTATELGDFLVRLRHGIDLLELGFATGAATFATTGEYEAQGSVTPIDWIRHHCRMSAHAAARSVAAGEQLGRLPATVAALDAGEIGFAHFSLLAGVARAVSATPGSGTVDAVVTRGRVRGCRLRPRDPATPTRFDERPLLALAREHSVSRFGIDCTHARHAHDAAAVLEEQVSAAAPGALGPRRCDRRGQPGPALLPPPLVDP